MMQHKLPQFRTIPDNEFWHYSVTLYAKEGVSKACLVLQEEYVLNVNILLTCCWFAASNRGSMPKQLISDLMSVLAPWNEKITQLLRSLRKKIAMRSELTDIKNQLLQLEIYSEKAQQAIIFDNVCGFNKLRRSQPQKTKDAMTNMQHYFSLSKVVLHESGYEATRLILATAFDSFQDKDFPQLNLGF